MQHLTSARGLVMTQVSSLPVRLMPRPPPPTQYVLIALFGLLPAGPAAAQVTILHSFTDSPGDGGYPYGSLILSGSTRYGMTQNGGTLGSYGTVFRIGTDGTA